jgi:hypothetical protein
LVFNDDNDNGGDDQDLLGKSNNIEKKVDVVINLYLEFSLKHWVVRLL